MTNKTDGGPAFPSKFEIKGPAYDPLKAKNVEPGMIEVYVQMGMTLRDYFAAKAMQAIIIGNGADECALGLGAAKDAYAMADHMLAQREDK